VLLVSVVPVVVPLVVPEVVPEAVSVVVPVVVWATAGAAAATARAETIERVFIRMLFSCAPLSQAGVPPGPWLPETDEFALRFTLRDLRGRN
jgi:hypothetical protein